ncbi:MAG: hypothetical protein ACODAQ_01780 [Phycisphaeraceae bacterium]
MSEVINRNEVRLIGLSRSGTHAISHWIMAQLDGRVCFLNCAEGKANPYATARPMGHGLPYETQGLDLDLEAERARRFRAKDWLLFTHEDSFLGHACSDVYEQHHDTWVGRSARRVDVLVLRDPFNLFASRLRRPAGMVKPAAAMRIWKQHARQFTRGPRSLRHGPVLISFNRWFSDRTYRQRLAERLGFAFTDKGRERVPSVFGGSSFDGLQYDGRAERMKVLERWKTMTDDEPYLALFDEEARALSEAVFGDPPPVFTQQAARGERGRRATEAAASMRT